MRIDGHTNLGLFPDTKNPNSKEQYTSVDDIVEYLTSQGITHHICLYPYDGYHLLEELNQRLPGVTHIGLQVLMGKDREHPTDIDNLQLDVSKPLCCGIKLASHRGWWLRDGKVTSGLDYGEYANVIKKKILDIIPDDFICSFHTQGDYKPNGGATPVNVCYFASEYPKLKFIINHSGDYAHPRLTSKPKLYCTSKNKFKPGFRHAYSMSLIRMAAEFANNMHNVWLEGSIWSEHKAIALQGCEKWIIGSDYPFGSKGYYYGKEYKRWNKFFTTEQISSNQDDFMAWLNHPSRVLIGRHLVKGGYTDKVDSL